MGRGAAAGSWAYVRLEPRADAGTRVGAGGGGAAQRHPGCKRWERRVPAEVCAHAAALGGEAPDSGSSRSPQGAHPSARGGGGRCAVSVGSGDSRGCDSRREGPRRG